MFLLEVSQPYVPHWLSICYKDLLSTKRIKDVDENEICDKTWDYSLHPSLESGYYSYADLTISTIVYGVILLNIGRHQYLPPALSLSSG